MTNATPHIWTVRPEDIPALLLRDWARWMDNARRNRASATGRARARAAQWLRLAAQARRNIVAERRRAAQERA